MRGRYFLRSASGMEGETEAERREGTGTGSYRVVEELKKVSTDRPLDQGQVSLMHGEVTGSGSGRKSDAVLGATGPPVDPPNLSHEPYSLVSCQYV